MSTLPVPPEQTTLFETGVDVSSVRAVRDRLLKSAHAHNTVRAYAFAWRSFRAWCVDAGRASLPASPDTLTLFAAWCVEQGFRLQTIQLRLAAILRYHVEAGLPTPMDDSVRELLASAAREKREPKAGKAALTLRQLRRMCTLLQNDASTISTRDCALLLLGFAAGWRRSSLASLDLSDVDFRRRGMLVVLRSSKTDQEGRGLLVGIPYGDPLADGPTIAASAQRALAGGTTLGGVLAAMARAERDGAPPLIAFTYVNLVVQYGLERFADGLVAAGAAGAIVPDIPLEETAELRALFRARGLALPLLVAPTTPAARAQEIARVSEGFVYLVSRLGVTGAKREPDYSWIADRVASLRRATAQPLAVGFGLSTAEHVRRAWDVADGAIVGSALIDAYASAPAGEAVERATAYIATLAGAPRPR